MVYETSLWGNYGVTLQAYPMIYAIELGRDVSQWKNRPERLDEEHAGNSFFTEISSTIFTFNVSRQG